MLSLTATAHARVSPERLRQLVYRSDPCLAHIIDHENRSWEPTRYGLGASYGLPQANPGSKMASAGADWRTSPWTQLKWARAYARSRYGSTCAAWRFWKANSWW